MISTASSSARTTSRGYLVEQEVGRRRDTGWAVLRREQFIEPVEERGGDADPSPRPHSVTAELLSQPGRRRPDSLPEGVRQVVEVGHDVLARHLGTLIRRHGNEFFGGGRLATRMRSACRTLRSSARPSP
jgi:hypothetical protein